MSNTIPFTTEQAAAVLAKSERGQQAAQDLLAFLDNGGDALDDEGRQAILKLLLSSWGGKAGTVRELLMEVSAT